MAKHKKRRSRNRISNKFVRFLVENKTYMLGAALLLVILVTLVVLWLVESTGREEILSQFGGMYGV